MRPTLISTFPLHWEEKERKSLGQAMTHTSRQSWPADRAAWHNLQQLLNRWPLPGIPGSPVWQSGLPSTGTWDSQLVIAWAFESHFVTVSDRQSLMVAVMICTVTQSKVFWALSCLWSREDRDCTMLLYWGSRHRSYMSIQETPHPS